MPNGLSSADSFAMIEKETSRFRITASNIDWKVSCLTTWWTHLHLAQVQVSKNYTAVCLWMISPRPKPAKPKAMNL